VTTNIIPGDWVKFETEAGTKHRGLVVEWDPTIKRGAIDCAVPITECHPISFFKFEIGDRVKYRETPTSVEFIGTVTFIKDYWLTITTDEGKDVPGDICHVDLLEEEPKP